jgi:hypothetical protein
MELKEVNDEHLFYHKYLHFVSATENTKKIHPPFILAIQPEFDSVIVQNTILRQVAEFLVPFTIEV